MDIFVGYKPFVRLIIGAIIFFTVPAATICAQEPSGDYFPALTTVILDSDSILQSKDLEELATSGNSLVISYRVRNLTFVIQGYPDYLYSYILEGYDDRPSLLSDDHIKDYTNLPPGDYRLVLNYTTAAGNSGSGTLISFRVLPPWFYTRAAEIWIPLVLISLIWFLYEHLNLRFARRRYALEQIINMRTEELIKEKEKSESLLANLLPKTTADEIMSKGKASKMKYNFVTVLFSDIQGFTRIAEEMNPEVLIDELDRFFFHFDSVVEQYNIEKIKTIGDAYMCAGGIPEKNRTNPVEVVLAAVMMQQYMAGLKAEAEKEGRSFWDIRIGIHTGTVVAGVVGHKKLSYDIWGDTVNTASRMESSGEPGKINISGTTYEFVKDYFVCEHRGKMPVKYKGELDMYFVTGFQPDMSNDGVSPNNKFMMGLQTMKLMDVEEFTLKFFDNEAPPNFYFHNSSYIKGVSTQIYILSRAEQLDEEDYIVAKLAGLFLFTGLIEDYDHPADASRIQADEVLPRLGFDSATIEKAREMILKFYREEFESKPMMILHDAVYDYLGRIDFISLTEKLMKECKESGNVPDQQEWISSQKDFVLNHAFRTRTSQMLMSVTPEEQVMHLEEYLHKTGKNS